MKTSKYYIEQAYNELFGFGGPSGLKAKIEGGKFTIEPEKNNEGEYDLVVKAPDSAEPLVIKNSDFKLHNTTVDAFVQYETIKGLEPTPEEKQKINDALLLLNDRDFGQIYSYILPECIRSGKKYNEKKEELKKQYNANTIIQNLEIALSVAEKTGARIAYGGESVDDLRAKLEKAKKSPKIAQEEADDKIDKELETYLKNRLGNKH